MTSRAYWLSRIAELDPYEDHEEIYKISFLHELPWDLNQALGFALASCMGSDVALILTRGRHPLRALRAHLTAHRAPTDPRRFVRVNLRFQVEGAVPPEAVARALALSRDKYCSVWHSLREDITFETSFEVTA